MKTTLASFLLLSSLAACGETVASSVNDPAEPPSTATDASTSDASTTDAATTDAAPVDAATSCGTLDNIAEETAFVAEPRDPPQAAGGSIIDGTYVLAAATIYTGHGGSSGPTGEHRRMTVRVSNGGRESASIFDGVVRTANLATEGTLLRTTNLCPSQTTDESPYTSDSSTLTMYRKRGGETMVLAFTKIGQ